MLHMMESPAENFKTGKTIQFYANQKNSEKENDPRHLRSAGGIGVVMDEDAQRVGNEDARRVGNALNHTRPDILTREILVMWQLEKGFKMHPVNAKKLLLNIATAAEKSSGRLTREAWYCFDLSKVTCEGDNWVVGQIDQVWDIPQNFPCPTICVAVGSVIYMMPKDSYHEQNNMRMYYLDTRNPENEWLEGPYMNVGRDIGSVVVHEGKIYVFGGVGEDLEGEPCSGKVYDPVWNSWELLSHPPTELDEVQGKFLGSYGDRKILVHPCISKMLIAYDVVDKSWEVLDDDFGYWNCRGVIIDDFLYVFYPMRIEIGAYDLGLQKWLKPINLDHLEWFAKTKRSEKLALYKALFFKVEANVLGLVWFGWKKKKSPNIYCKMFSIKRIMQENGEVGLEAEVYSSTIYSLGEPGHCLDYVLV